MLSLKGLQVQYHPKKAQTIILLVTYVYIQTFELLSLHASTLARQQNFGHCYHLC